jgi:hypothetical protein
MNSGEELEDLMGVYIARENYKVDLNFVYFRQSLSNVENQHYRRNVQTNHCPRFC